jgi:hypothetical protein
VTREIVNFVVIAREPERLHNEKRVWKMMRLRKGREMVEEVRGSRLVVVEQSLKIVVAGIERLVAEEGETRYTSLRTRLYLSPGTGT